MNKTEFPIFQNYPELVYLDSAATSQKPQQVIDSELNFYKLHNANVHRGIYKLSEDATSLYEEARELLALFLQAEKTEIIFTPGATASMNFVALGLGEKIIKANSDDLILTTKMEHHSSFLPWQQLALRKGVKIEAINVRDYRLDLEELELILKTGKVKVFALTHMSNVLGTINPVAEITAMVRQLSPETIVVVDGAQFAPHYPVNVKALDVDFYAIAGHKMLGPTGVGVLYGKKVLLEQMDPVFVGGGMITKVELTKSEWENIPTKFEAGTPNIAQAIGLAEAVRFINKMGFPDINKHESELIDYFLAKVEDVKGLTVLGPNENKDRGAVFSFNIEGIHAHDLAQMLDEDDIAIRAGHHCNQVLLRDVLKVPATARASFYLYNDYKDIDKLVVGLEKAKKRLLRTVTT